MFPLNKQHIKFVSMAKDNKPSSLQSITDTIINMTMVHYFVKVSRLSVIFIILCNGGGGLPCIGAGLEGTLTLSIYTVRPAPSYTQTT